MDRKHPIPLMDENDMILGFQHGCTYTIEMTSKPYSYADQDYIFKNTYTVPDCIGQYCKCEGKFFYFYMNLKKFFFIIIR